MSEGADDPDATRSARRAAGRRDDDATKLDRPSERPSERAIGPDFGERYRVLATVGKGGMGEVFRAYDAELRTEVALKIVHGDEPADGAVIARFRREVALARKVTSPNVLRVYDLAEYGGLQFLSMEYVDGEDLGALLRRERRLPLERALAIFRQVCVGLIAAHEQGIVHRDLKPHNVLVDHDDHVRVADFGLARSIGESGMTVSGAVLGSPAYMSPEQVKGEEVDARSDIYSLGVMLYQLVTGVAPFQGASAHEVMEARLHSRPKPMREVSPDVPPHIQEVAARCLELVPADRYPSVAALLAELMPPSRRDAPTRRRRGLRVALAGGVAVAVGGAIAAWLATRGPPAKAPEARPPVVATSAGRAELSVPAVVLGGTQQIVVLDLGTENLTIEPVLDDAVDRFLVEGLYASKRIELLSTTRVKVLSLELEPTALPLDDRLAAVVASKQHRPALVMRSLIKAKGAGFEISLTFHDGRGAELLARTVSAQSADDIAAACFKIGRAHV
jgi:predicted Ser/Thr protein kinase